MSAPFERTFRSLHADRWPRWEHALLLALGLLGAWLAWASFGEVTLRARSVAARVQAQDASYQLVAQVEGALLEVSAAVGEPVEAGQVLFRIDDSELRLQHAAADAERESLILRLNHIDGRIANQEQALVALERARAAGAKEGAALAKSGAASADLNALDAEVSGRLAEQGALSERERRAAQSAATAATLDAAALRSGASRQEEERLGTLLLAQNQLMELQSEQARLEGELMAVEAKLQQVIEGLARCAIYAPVDGVLASAADLVPGARVEVGQVLATVVAPAELFVVAELDPAASLGRVAVGQAARLQVDGFPRVAYGTLPAVVERVASEPMDGGLRVELSLVGPGSGAIPLRHGMSGVAEIDVERLSPAELMLRASGRWLDGSPP